MYWKVTVTKEKENAEHGKGYEDMCICVWRMFILSKVVGVGQTGKVTLKVFSLRSQTHLGCLLSLLLFNMVQEIFINVIVKRNTNREG